MTAERRTPQRPHAEPVTHREVVWERLDGTGADIALLRTAHRFSSHGGVVAARPVPHLLHYAFATDPGETYRTVDVEVEGAGWSRRLHMSRNDDQRRVVTDESGNLDDALAVAARAAAPSPGIDDADRLEEFSTCRSARSRCP